MAAHAAFPRTRTPQRLTISIAAFRRVTFAAAANVNRRKAAILIGSLWGIFVLGKAAWTAVFH